MPQKIEAPREESCKDCRYYLHDSDLELDGADIEDAKDDGEEVLTGFCRRYPPTILMAYPEPVTRHPDVAGHSDWCGEFTPKS